MGLTPLSITDSSQLISGPIAQGRMGDLLLENDRIRVIIQKPGKNSDVNSFGGNIIDADIKRASGQGQDQWGTMFPLVNVEWTVNNQRLEVMSDGKDGSDIHVRAHGIIDVYDYLDIDFIAAVAETFTGKAIAFPNRFDDRKNPFEIYEDLRGIQHEVITDYTLSPGDNYVRMTTTYVNNGSEDTYLPLGQFLNGTGQLSMLIPGQGFTPDLLGQIASDTPAMIFAGFENVDVSYGYFYEMTPFYDRDTESYRKTSSISYSGVNGIMFGEEFMKMLMGASSSSVNTIIPANDSLIITSYFVVGNGSAGSVFDTGLDILNVPRKRIVGQVLDKSGNPVKNATIAVVEKGKTIITYRSDSNGDFQGQLSTGTNSLADRFGSGKYDIYVYKSGFHENETIHSGLCVPAKIDLSGAIDPIACTLGDTSHIVLKSPIIDSDTNQAVPVRLTIVGEDPSPNKIGSAGRFFTNDYYASIYGVMDVKYITEKGTFDLSGESTMNIEPGDYMFVISRGPEYKSVEIPIQLSPGQQFEIDNVFIERAVKTPGYISADFHIHSIVSPDSSMTLPFRVLSAAAESLDVIQSSDHDVITDYAPAYELLIRKGWLSSGMIQTSVGDEITPNHYGHLHAFPLESDPEDPDGGAIDWSHSANEHVSPAPDYVMSLQDIISEVRKDPGEEVIQLNHIMDIPTGIFAATGWVTSPLYMDSHDVQPFSSYADPIERRMHAMVNDPVYPLYYDQTPLMALDFNAMELVVGPHLHDDNMLFRSALPTWFNMLNLGFRVSATANSDSHRATPNPVGLPRNYIASSTDPRDGLGNNHGSIDLENYAHSINTQHISISAGPIIMMEAKNETGHIAQIGDTISGKKIALTIDVTAASWAWFDTIDIYANTMPMPVDDETGQPMQGVASDPSEFYKPYHIPQYTYAPLLSFKLSDGTLTEWHEDDGVISATVMVDLHVAEDTWVVAFARGTKDTSGYRSLFPMVTQVLVDSDKYPNHFDPMDLSTFHTDSTVGASAWAMTNPIFIDSDDNGFRASHVLVHRF